MALNRDRIGHRYAPYTYEVSREKVREYADATGLDDPIYRADPRDVAAAEVVAPPTFAACFTVGDSGGAIHGDPELGAHRNLVHGAQEYIHHRPVRVGDVLECTPWIVDIAERGRMELLTLQVDVVDAEDRTAVLTSRGTIIFFSEDR